MTELPEDQVANDSGARDLTEEPSPFLLLRAARQVRTGGIVAALWGLVLLGCGGLGFLGFSNFSPFYWDILGGYALLACALGAAMRNRGAMAAVSLLAATDLPVQVLAISAAMEQRVSSGLVLAVVRLGMLPSALYLIVRGYRGAVDYYRLRGGMPPRNWRLWAPLPFMTGFVVCVGAAVSLSMYWKETLLSGFAQPGAKIQRKDHASPGSPTDLFAALRAIDVKPFRETHDGERKDTSPRGGKSEPDRKDAPAQAPVGTVAPASGAAAEFEDPAALPKSVREAVEEAKAFAAKADNADCFGEALRRYDECAQDECRLLARAFLSTCLPASRSSKDFCSSVPSPVSIVETTTWRTRVCDQNGRVPAPCYVLFLSLQNYCHPEVAGQPETTIGGNEQALRRLMGSVHADLRSVDVKRFRNMNGNDQTGDASKRGSGDLSDERDVTGGESAAASGNAAMSRSLATLPDPMLEAVEQGAAFAGRVDNAGCLAEARRRHDACTEDECRLLAKIFMTACLPASRPSENFCKSVPSPVSIVETTAWRTRFCDPRGRAPAHCYVFLLSMQNFCHPEALER